MYQITYDPIIEDGEWNGVLTSRVTCQRPDDISEETHNQMAHMLLQLQMMLSYFEESPDAYEDFVVWFRTTLISQQPKEMTQ